MSFSDDGGSATTTNGGYYSGTLYHGWHGTATAEKPGGTMTPGSRSYAGGLTSDQPGQNFTWRASPTISGRITDAETGLGAAGVAVLFSAGGGTATADGAGDYSRMVPYGWSGTATPQGSGTSVPAARTYSAVTANAAGQDFAWTPADPVISGRVTNRYTGAGVGGVQLVLIRRRGQHDQRRGRNL